MSRFYLGKLVGFLQDHGAVHAPKRTGDIEHARTRSFEGNPGRRGFGREARSRGRTSAIRSRGFTSDRAWGALDVATMLGISVRLHWTDHPYKWHVNDGKELLAVLDRTVDMHQREAEQAHRVQTARRWRFPCRGGMRTCCAPPGRSAVLDIEHKDQHLTFTPRMPYRRTAIQRPARHPSLYKISSRSGRHPRVS